MHREKKNNLIKRQNAAQTYLHLQRTTALEAKSNFLLAGGATEQGKRSAGQLHTRYCPAQGIRAGVNRPQSQLTLPTLCNTDALTRG